LAYHFYTFKKVPLFLKDPLSDRYKYVTINILTKDWIRVQNLIHQNTDKAPRAGTGSYGILTRLLRRKQCGSKMRVSLKHNKGKGITHHYYKCLTKEQSRGSRCDIQNLNGKDTDQIVLDELKRLVLDESNLATELGLKRKLSTFLKMFMI
jgi:site-specific DNA recombinase